ncbi:MAG: class I SAM-dependent rRNA methyltransferase [Bacteroidota bacterium]
MLPKITPQRIAVKVKAVAERSIRQEHPWIFESSITKQSAEAKAGDLAIIYDKKKNKFLALGLFDPHSPIRIKLIQFKRPATLDEDWFKERVKTAYQKRQPLLATDTNSYRLIYGENDGFPNFIADVYAEVLVVKLYAAIWLPYLHILLPILLKASNCKTLVLRLSRNMERIHPQLHGLQNGQVLHGTLEKEVIIFREHGLQFTANVIRGHKTGYFLDHRHNRQKIGMLSKGKRVLDIFAYAGGFSVHALAGGAKEVVSLDISKQALNMATENVHLNGLSAQHGTLAVDAFKGMQALEQDGKRFDIVIVDPPSFAKQDSECPKALQAYRRLAKLAIPLVAKNGILLLASCSSRINAEDFFKNAQQALESSKRIFQ